MHVIPFTGPAFRRPSDQAHPAAARVAPTDAMPDEREPPTLLELQAAFVRAAGIWLATRDHKGLSDLSY